MIRKFLEALPFSELTKFDSTQGYKQNSSDFIGAPRKHPYDHNKIILVQSPFTAKTVFFEFSLQDILHIEDLPRIATENGENIRIVKLWIRRGSVALRFQAFEVGSEK